MAKGDIKIKTVNDAFVSETKEEKMRRMKSFDKLIRNTKIVSKEDMKKRADEAYEQQVLEEDKLLDAFENKRVKSKNAISKALRLKKERAAAAERKNDDAEQNLDTASDDKDVEEVTESVKNIA